MSKVAKPKTDTKGVLSFGIIEQPGNLYSLVKVQTIGDKVTDMVVEPAKSLALTLGEMNRMVRDRWIIAKKFD